MIHYYYFLLGLVLKVPNVFPVIFIFAIGHIAILIAFQLIMQPDQ